MALIPSNMFPLGQPAPDFLLPNPCTDKMISLSDCSGEKGTIVVFMCNHCPFVVHVLDGILSLANDYQEQGIGFVAISSNDITTHPEDAPHHMAQLAKDHEFSFPYLFDANQTVAKAYDAACTPDFYLFDSALLCVYRGRMDESRPGNEIAVTGKELRSALDALLAGHAISPDQQPSMGCNIKWKS